MNTLIEQTVKFLSKSDSPFYFLNISIECDLFLMQNPLSLDFLGLDVDFFLLGLIYQTID